MGYVDPTLMQTRYWAISIDGVPLPESFMALLESIKVEESTSERNKCIVRFNDLRHTIPKQGGGFYTTLNDVATTKNHYFFERGRELTVSIGYDPNKLVETWLFVISKVKPDFPEDGDPQLTIEALSKKQRLRIGRTTTLKPGSLVIRKLSDVLVPIAQNHKLSYQIDDVIFMQPHAFTILGTDTDQTIVERLGDEYGRTSNVIGNTLVFIYKDRTLHTPQDDFRYQLCYRCGDSSCKSFRAIEHDRSRKSKNQKQSTSDSDVKNAYIDDTTGLEHVTHLSDDGSYGVADHREKISDVIDPESESLQESMPTTYDQMAYEGTREGSSEYDEVIMYDGSTGSHIVHRMEREIGETTNEEVSTDTPQDPDDANKKAAGKSKSPSYDAEIVPSMFDPFLKLNVQIELFGLGVRWSGTKGNKYIIKARTVSMARDSGPDLSLSTVRYRKPKPSAREAEPSVDPGTTLTLDPYDGQVEGLRYNGGTGTWDVIQVVNETGDTTAHDVADDKTVKKND